jgi:hypothetical protein
MTSLEMEERSFEEWSMSKKTIWRFLIKIPKNKNPLRGSGLRGENMGIKNGVCNFFLAVKNEKYAGFFLLLKEPKEKKPLVKQMEIRFLSEMTEQGYKAEVYFGCKAAGDALLEYVGDKND